MQSQRVQIYKDYAQQLIDSGHAYRCFCSETRLELIRKEAAKNREIPRYDNRCRKLSKQEIDDNLGNNMPFTVRLILRPGDVVFDDIVYGKVVMDLSQKEADPILLKSDKFPTYHLANVVDDHLMQISHVLRGVEWQTSTPKHIMLYEAFGWKAPQFAHLPLIMNKDGTKLSKRQNDIQIESLRSQGYLPEAVTCYLSNIGGGFGRQVTDEISTLEELAEQFDLNTVNKHSGRIDGNKMQLYNRLAIESRLKADKQSLIDELRRLLVAKFGSIEVSDDELSKRLQWSTDRVFFVKQLIEEFAYIWTCPRFDFDITKLSNHLGDLSSILEDTICLVDELESTGFVPKLDAFRGFCAERNLNFSKYMQLLRYATTNSKEGPPITDVLEILGGEKFCSYLKEAANYVKSDATRNKEKV